MSFQGKPIFRLIFSNNGDPPYNGCGLIPKRDTYVRFVLQSSSPLYARNPKLITNYPTSNKPFSRETWYEVQSSASPSGTYDWSADILMNISGAFEYYLTWNDNGTQKKGKIGHFTVTPHLKVRDQSKTIGCLCIQTVLTKCLGSFDRWEQHFIHAAQAGYNMLHFTPIQELGHSQSAYSLFHQHIIADYIFPNQHLSQEEKHERIRKLFEKATHELGVLTLGDVVLNHTADNSAWLESHPEASYNPETSPHLNPALALDMALTNLSSDLISGKYVQRYQIQQINSEHDLGQLRSVLTDVVIPSVKLWEYYVVNVEKSVGEFTAALLQRKKATKMYPNVNLADEDAVQNILRSHGIRCDPKMERWCYSVDIDFALGIFGRSYYERTSIDQCCDIYKRHLDYFNAPRYKELNEDVACAIDAIIGAVKHEILEKRLKITEERHLVNHYFHAIREGGKKDGKIITYAACNGWIFGGSPTEDFAGPNSKAYLRREIIIWGDSIKLRYGKGPEDNPWLWEHMKKYTQDTALLFHGIRLDNCHSTPLHVARYLIDAARQVRPDLYVIAELFTGSTDLDRLYISKLGINSLIREAMQAPNATEMSRLCFLYGGSPVGSVVSYYPPQYYDQLNTQVSNDRDLPVLTLTEPPALFFDCTHDNEVPAEKRHPRDSLSNAALVSMIACPIGSVRGYDQIVPDRIDLVTETKWYPTDKERVGNGMIVARKIFNELHRGLEENGYSEQHTHQDGNMIVIQRHNPETHKAVYAACHTAFSKDGRSDGRQLMVKVPGKITKVLGYYSLDIVQNKAPEDLKFIQGMVTNLIVIHDDKKLEDIFSRAVVQNGVDQYEEVRFKHFPPGAVLLFEVEIPDDAKVALQILDNIDQDYEVCSRFDKIDAMEFGFLFYSCENEELSTTHGQRGCYDIPNFGKLPYAGITGLVGVLNIIRKNNDMGHPLFDNFRAGNWMMDYIQDRLKVSRKYRPIAGWLKHYFQQIKNLPRHFVPKYLDKVVLKYYLTGVHYVCTKLMGPFISENIDPFVEQLALTSFQFVGVEPNAYLIDPSLADFGKRPLLVSMAAGLPHFSTGFMRSWGRDTFIALRGLLLVTGRWLEAKDLLIGFASALRHGLIPNLLDAGRGPRFNARDATWWFMQALQDYCKMSPEGIKILSESVPSLFPWDAYFPTDVRSTHKKDFATIIQEIMQQHARGIDFRERNAGPKIDDKMQEEGFNIKIRFDPHTGFIFGGNSFNCGTWMDKMGESHKAKNYGTPATPRDGADIEIVGLLKSATRWLTELVKEKSFPHKGVNVFVNELYPDESCLLSYSEWDLLIQQNFEQQFYIPMEPSEDTKYINKQLVNRRGIYKDIVGSKTEWANYQLRPNQCIAMVVAPELFNRQHARHAIHNVEKILAGPLGLKTLDPSDWNYRPNYENAYDTDDFKTSKGFNYHQGPEWVWCYGFFLRAKIQFDFDHDTDPVKIRNSIQQLIQHHRLHIKEDKWQGLPELTNENGKYCYYSCPTQAWSSATILDALYDMHKLTKRK